MGSVPKGIADWRINTICGDDVAQLAAGTTAFATLEATLDSPDHILDTSGSQCPIPVLKARKALKTVKEGGLLRMLATDPAAAIDVPHFCAEQGHTLVEARQEGETLVFHIRKGL
ncbi:MAG: sulfurtransferase TusA family protein [Pseudomonadota bacterium]